MRLVHYSLDDPYSGLNGFGDLEVVGGVCVKDDLYKILSKFIEAHEDCSDWKYHDAVEAILALISEKMPKEVDLDHSPYLESDIGYNRAIKEIRALIKDLAEKGE